jgi:hypothetical protein
MRGGGGGGRGAQRAMIMIIYENGAHEWVAVATKRIDFE